MAVTLLALLVLALLGVRYYRQHQPSPQPFPAPVVVSVQGDVRRPGIYLLPVASAGYEDAVAAAGGLSVGEAGDCRFEPLAGLACGDLLRVTGAVGGGCRVTVEPMPAGARLLLGQPLDLNHAAVEELCLVPRMRPEFAAYIVKRRQTEAWRDLQELTVIPGVGAKTIEQWRPHLSVGNGD